MNRKQDDLNEDCFNNPKPGHYWCEHFVLYFVILDVLKNGNLVIAEKDQDSREGQTVSLHDAKEIDREEFAKQVRYRSIPGFVADVVPDSKIGKVWVRDWKTDYNSQYRPLTELAPVITYSFSVCGDQVTLSVEDPTRNPAVREITFPAKADIEKLDSVVETIQRVLQNYTNSR